MTKTQWALFSLFVSLVGCQTTGVFLKDKNFSLAEIREAVVAISGQPRQVSRDERELISPYFSRNRDPDFDSETARERLYTQFMILGDRRPYDIQVEVRVERKKSSGYEDIGQDPALSKKMAIDLAGKLNQSRNSRNVIDDFRPF